METEFSPDSPLAVSLGGFPPGSLTAMLKDADALDRARLGKDPDPRYLRHGFTAERID